MTQPILTYTVDWGTGNVYQKLSGKSYVNPNGQTVDCSSITVTFSSSVHFKKFYATAVKDGNDYGFINDILVDIRETNPTGILLYELTERNANVNFNFTINISQLTAGDGQYRISLYVQDDNNIWNYEYFLIDSQGNYLQDNQGNYLQIPVVAALWIPIDNYLTTTIADAGIEYSNGAIYYFMTANNTIYTTGTPQAGENAYNASILTTGNIKKYKILNNNILETRFFMIDTSIADPNDENPGYTWTTDTSNTSKGIQNNSIGAGILNTNTMLNRQDYGTAFSYMAEVNSGIRNNGGFTDWFLGTVAEYELFTNSLPTLWNAWFWTSVEGLHNNVSGYGWFWSLSQNDWDWFINEEGFTMGVFPIRYLK